MTARLPRAHLGGADETTVVICAMRGDDEAYAELVRRRQSSVRGLLRRLCRDPALADDLAQQVFLTAWRTLSGLKAPAAFGAWLRRLTVNRWLMDARVRREAPLPEAALESLDEAREAPLGERLDLDRALAQLPRDVRVCIVLAYVERMSHAEISAATGLALGTVKSHISRGSARLRTLLDAYGAMA